MKMRSIGAVGVAAMLSVMSVGCSRDRMEIVLEGPWLLYQDTQFDEDGHGVPVVIVIAPGTAIDYKDIGNPGYTAADNMHHKPPQLSTGDGFFIATPGIYCLTFDNKCAPKGADSLKADHYQQAVPLPIHATGEQSGRWNWPKAIGENDIALILPMPDSYSNDGVWHMRFGSSFSPDGSTYGNDQRHSIGLEFHYTKGPEQFNLLKCDGTPSLEHCKVPPVLNRRVTSLENSGTLRIQMKAPDDGDGCDGHVRFSYKQMFAMDHSFEPDEAVIEPAHLDGKTQQMVYDNAQSHFCLDRDPQGIHPGTPMNGAQHSSSGMQAQNSMGIREIALPSLPTVILNILVPDIDCIRNSVHSGVCWTPSQSNNQDFALGTAYLKAAQHASEGFDMGFPRISQVLRVAQFLNMSGAALNQFESDKGVDLTGPQREALKAVLKKVSPMDNADGPGKNGSDCRAALMMVQ